MSRNRLNDYCMLQLGNFIEANECLIEIDLGQNRIANKGIEILTEHMIGNTGLKLLWLNGNTGIKNSSVPYLLEAITKSNIAEIHMNSTCISDENKKEIRKAFKIPIDQRQVPIKSKSKSAAKIS